MSPRNKAQVGQIRTQSIGKILDAAFTLIAKNGYESTSISQIANMAGVSKGLIYNYFDSKEELLRALIDNAMTEGDNLMTEIITDDPSQTLTNLFTWYFDELRNRIEKWRLIMELTFKIDKFDFVQDMAKNKSGEYVAFISGLLEQIGIPNPKQEAQLIAGLFDGIGIQYLVIKNDYPLDEMENYLKEKYCRKNLEIEL